MIKKCFVFFKKLSFPFKKSNSMKKQALLVLILCIGFQLQAQKILFIGNSLTYSNALPEILEEIGNTYNKKIRTEMSCFPNYAIVDHLEEGNVQKKIATENYDYVIIQQGPSSQEEGRKMLIDSGNTLSALCKKHNTKLGYFMVWPSKRYYFTFDKVIANHTEAASLNEALLFPVGTHWKDYNSQQNKISLYAGDHFHPSKAGSFFAALVLFKQLFPNEALQAFPFRTAKRWVPHKKSYRAMIALIED